MVALSHLPITDHIHRLPWVYGAGFYVDFFFVLSGFVIAHRYADAIADRPALGTFIWRRFARLWPLHMACLAILWVMRLAIDHGGSPSALATFDPLPVGRAAVAAIASNIALLQGVLWHPSYAIDGPSWSISTELYTYLVFGAVCLLASRLRRPYLRVVLATLLALVGAGVLAACSRSGMGDIGTWSIFRCLCEFFVGVLAWQLWRAGGCGRLGGTSVEVAVIAVAGLFVWAAAHVARLHYLSPVVFAAVILIFANERGAASRLLRSRPAAKLGLWSYSIYLAHMIVVTLVIFAVHLAERFDGGFASLAIVTRPSASVFHIAITAPAGDVLSLIYLIAVIALASVTFAVIEVPGQRIFGPARSRRRAI